MAQADGHIVHVDDGPIRRILDMEREKRYKFPEQRFEIENADVSNPLWLYSNTFAEDDCVLIEHPEWAGATVMIYLLGNNVRLRLLKMRTSEGLFYWNAYIDPSHRVRTMYRNYVFRMTNERLPVHQEWTTDWGMDSRHLCDRIAVGYPMKAWLQEYGNVGYKDIVYMYDILVRIDEMIGRHLKYIPCLNDMCIDVIRRADLDVSAIPPAVLIKNESRESEKYDFDEEPY